MDLQSYIQLKNLARGAMSPAQQIEEQVETVEEEILDEVWGDAFSNKKDMKKLPDPEGPAPKAKRSAAGSEGSTGDALGARLSSKSTPPKSRASSLPTNLKATEKMATKKANDFRAASNKAKGLDKKPAETKAPATATGGGSAKPAGGGSKPAPSAPASAKPKPTPAKQTGDKAKDMASWAKANPTLANKKKTPNPLMKKMGLSKPKAPATATGGDWSKSKPATSAGAKAAMSAAKPMSRIAKATSNIKPMKEDFDIILDHLIEQGFPQEEALKLMVNMPEEKREQILEMRHRDAKTGEVTDKPEIGKTYYTDGPRQKSSVALRKEKEAAEKKKVQTEGMHRDAKTGEVVDKAEVGKTYYPNMPRQKSSVALRKEKEAKERKKTNKEEMDSLFAAYQTMLVSERKEMSTADQMELMKKHWKENPPKDWKPGDHQKARGKQMAAAKKKEKPDTRT